MTIIRAPRALGAAGQHLDVLELAQVGEGLDVHELKLVLAGRLGLGSRADRDPGRVGGGHLAVRPARRREHLVLGDRVVGLDEVEQQVLGIADLWPTMPVGPFGRTSAETALSWSLISSITALPPVRSRTRPTSPSPVTTASLPSIPALEPLSIVTVEYQTVGERPMTRPVTSSNSPTAGRLVDELAQLAELLVVAEPPLGVDKLASGASASSVSDPRSHRGRRRSRRTS